MFKSMSVADYKSDNDPTVRADTDLFEAIDIILTSRISGVTVLSEDGEVVGMLSELDCLRAILKSSYYQESGGVVGDYMASPCRTVGPDDDVITVAEDIIKHSNRRRPIVRDGRYEGLVSCRQILRAVRDWHKSGKEKK